MIIKGFQATTLLDYPGQIASIIFTPGCTFRCPFCYNKSLVENSKELKELDEGKIFETLKGRKKLIDGVVITGGEPTMFKDLPDFIRKLKSLGFKVKLDTNGTNPEMIKQLIKEKLIDYVAMDIKSSFEKYELVSKVKFDFKKINESASLIMNGGVDYEFRTTAVPSLVKEKDFVNIGIWLKGAKTYGIQQFKPMKNMIDDGFIYERNYSVDDLNRFKDILKPYFKEVEVRA